MSHEGQPPILSEVLQISTFRFSPDARENLQKRGYIILELNYSSYEGMHTRALNFPRTRHIIEGAIDPNHLQLPIYVGDNSKSKYPAILVEKVTEGHESISKYSEEISKQIPEAAAIEGSLYLGEIYYEYKKLTGKELPDDDEYRMFTLIVPSNYKEWANDKTTSSPER